MKPIRMNDTLARACAIDAGNRAMRSSGRTAWNLSDYRACCAELDRAWPLCELCKEPAGEGGAICPACAQSR